MREYLRTALVLAGFDVQLAPDGVSALREVNRRRPDAVVLDLDLPLLTGLGVHEALQQDERTRHVPVIVVTGTSWQSPLPVAARLTKPVAADELVTAVFDVLSRTAMAVATAGEESALGQRTVLWLCPECRRAMHETMEPGHMMTSEMRVSAGPCPTCQPAS